MFRFKFFILSVFLLTSTSFAAGLSDFFGGNKTENNYSILSVIQNYYQLTSETDSKRVELGILKLPTQSTNKKTQSLNEELQILGQKKAALKDQIDVIDTESDSESITKIQNQISAIDAEIESQKELIAQAESKISQINLKRETQIQTLSDELETLESQLETSQLRLQTYIESLIKKVLLAFSIWIIALALKWIVNKILTRVNFNMTPQRRTFIEQLTKIAINIVAIVAILIVFFSQLIGALPYFAIFATVITLALKDVILSVIAWIIIGTKDGYKVGHYLHIGTLWGTVVEINPFNTIVRQGGISGPTGRLLTFPNKKIFEEFLENWSKWHNFTYLKWDFYLEQDSNFSKAEKIMLEVLAESRINFADKIKQKKNQLLKLGITDEDLEPLAFWEIQANGVLLRGKMLVDFDDFFLIRSEVTKNFLEAISAEEDITLRFVNNLIPNDL